MATQGTVCGHGPRIRFQVVPEPKAGKNRLHFDLGVSPGRAAPLDEDHYGVVLQDPESNEICLH